MVVIPKEAVTRDGKHLITEASTAGLAPGEWPPFIGVADAKGEGFLFGPSFGKLGDGGRRYFSTVGSGITLTVFND